ncbi:hypothetical protein Tco_0199178 [Tanacetum coccineum]
MSSLSAPTAPETITPTDRSIDSPWPLIYLNAQLSSYTSGHLEVFELAACLEKLHFLALLDTDYLEESSYHCVPPLSSETVSYIPSPKWLE